jgi:hypothetical protein
LDLACKLSCSATYQAPIINRTKRGFELAFMQTTTTRTTPINSTKAQAKKMG